MALWRVMWWSITLIASGLVIYAGIVAMQELTEEKAASEEVPEWAYIMAKSLVEEGKMMEANYGVDEQ